MNRFLRHRLLRSAAAWQSAVLGAGMITAGGLDYAVNVVAGRWLDPLDFGEFVTVMAILQVITLMSISIRMVVAYYTADVSAAPDARQRIAAFLRQVTRWAWRCGIAGSAVAIVLAPLLARSLRFTGAWPLWAASGMVLMLFLREAAFGGLQGVQSFVGLSVVQVIQGVLRVALCAALISLGARATGAVLAQPIAACVCVALSFAWLRPHRAPRGEAAGTAVSWHYAISTLLGLVVFGLLTNSDALFVRRFFDARTAGNYGPVVTLAKICLFLPFAIGLVLFPKVARRRAAGMDTRAILLVALVAALTPGFCLTAVYFLVPGQVVKAMFTGAYANPGVVLGLASLAATLYAGLHIWLNYALSSERKIYVFVLAGVLGWQLAGMWLYGRGDLVRMTMVMVSAGLAGNVAGYLTTWSTMRVAQPAPAEAVGP